MKLKHRQFGAKKLKFTSSSQPLLAMVFFAGCVTASAQEAEFQYYRFTPTTLRDNTDAQANSVQLSDFRFLFEGNPVDRSGVTVTNPKGNTPGAEGSGNLVDEDPPFTKWLDFYKNGVVFDFGSPTAIDGYGFSTANDQFVRDPVRWVFEGSNDGSTWTLLDHRTDNFAVPTERNTPTADIPLPASPAAAVLNWTGGATGDWNTTAANWNGGADTWNNGHLLHARFSGAASTVTLTEGITARNIEFASAGHLIQGGTITLDGISRLDAQAGANGEIASSIEGSLGLVKTGEGTITLSGNNNYSGLTHVREGVLGFSGSGTTTLSGGQLIITSIHDDAGVTVTDSHTLTGATEIYVGNHIGTTGFLAISGDAIVQKGGTGGYITAGRGNSTGTITVEDNGKLLSNAGIRLAEGANAEGTLNVSGNAEVTWQGEFQIGNTGTGTLNIDGGTLAALHTNGSQGGALIVGRDGGTGTVVFDDGVIHANNELRVGYQHQDFGGANDRRSTGHFTMNGGTLNIDNQFAVGRDGGHGTFILKDGAVTLGVDSSTTVPDTNSWMRVGYLHGSTGVFEMEGGTLSVGGAILVGEHSSGVRGQADGAFTMTGGTATFGSEGTLAGQDNRFISVGLGGGKGALSLSGDATLTQIDEEGAPLRRGRVGFGNGAEAIVTLSDNSELYAPNLRWQVGDFGGGPNNSGTAEVTLNDNSGLTLHRLTIGHIGNATASATVTVNGNASLTVNDFIIIGRDDNTGNDGMNSQLVLNGGVVATSSIQAGGGTTSATHNTVVANGGTIRALADTADFFQATAHSNGNRSYVKIADGGLTFDTDGFDVGIEAALNGDAENPGGGLVKTGEGTLALNGNSTYTGATIVSAGTLLVNGALGSATDVIVESAGVIGGSGLIEGSLHLEVGAGFVFDPSGTLTVNGGTVTFGSFSIASLVGFDSSVSNGEYDLIDGTAEFVYDNITNWEADPYPLDGDRYAYFEEGSLRLIVVPEPSSLLFAFGALGLLGARRRR